MKTTTFITAFILFCLTGLINAQIKVFDGGNVSVGSTITPAYGCRLQVVGKSVFTENTQAIESAAYIRGLNRYSTASTPDYTWYYNDNSGIIHPSTNTICLSTNATEVIRFAWNGNILISHTIDYGEKLSVNAGNQTAFETYVNHDIDFKYGMISRVNRLNSKALAVLYNNEEKFRVYGNGDVWAYGHYTGSDIYLKENIIPIEDALKKVM